MTTHSNQIIMNLSELRPGMEELDLEVTIVSLEEQREVETHRGLKHVLVEGVVKDDTASREGYISAGRNHYHRAESRIPGNQC